MVCLGGAKFDWSGHKWIGCCGDKVKGIRVVTEYRDRNERARWNSETDGLVLSGLN